MFRSEKVLILQTLILLVFVSWAFGGRVSWAPPWIIVLAGLAVVPLVIRWRERPAAARGAWSGERGARSEERPGAARGAWSVERGVGSPERGAGGSEQGAWSEEHGARSEERGAWGGELGAGSSGRGAPFTFRGFLLLLPLLLYGVVVGVSLLNPSYEVREVSGDRILLELREYVEWLPSTIFPERTFAAFSVFAVLLFQGVVVYHVMRTRRAMVLLLGLLIANTALMAVGGTVVNLLDLEKIWGFRESPNSRFFGSFVMVNHWATFALLSITAALGLFFRRLRQTQADPMRSRQAHGSIYLGAAVLIALTIPLGGSRAGMILLVFLLLCFLMGQGLALIYRMHWTARVKRLAAAGSLCLFTLFVGYTLILTWPVIEQRWESTQRTFDRGLENYSRFNYWDTTWQMVEAQPIWGWGFGTFRMVHPLFANERFMNRHGEQRRFLVDAHNDWLQFLSETGWAGLALLLITPLALLLAYLFRGRYNPVSNWCLIGCLCMGLHAIVDFPFQSPAVLALFITLFAVAMKWPSGLRPAAAQGARSGLCRARSTERGAWSGSQNLVISNQLWAFGPVVGYLLGSSTTVLRPPASVPCSAPQRLCGRKKRFQGNNLARRRRGAEWLRSA